MYIIVAVLCTRKCLPGKVYRVIPKNGLFGPVVINRFPSGALCPCRYTGLFVEGSCPFFVAESNSWPGFVSATDDDDDFGKKKKTRTYSRPIRLRPVARHTPYTGYGEAGCRRRERCLDGFSNGLKKNPKYNALTRGVCVCVCVFALFSVCPSLPPVSVGGGDSKVDHRCRLRCGRRWSEIVFGHQSRRQYYPVVLRLKLYFFFAYTNSRRYFYQFSKILTVTIGRAQIFYLFYVRNKTKNVVITSKIHEFRE